MCSRVPSFKGFSSSGLAGWPVWSFPRNRDQGSQGSDVGPGRPPPPQGLALALGSLLPQSPAQVLSSVRKQDLLSGPLWTSLPAVLEHLLCVKHCPLPCSHIISLNPPSDPKRWVLVVFPFYSCVN